MRSGITALYDTIPSSVLSGICDYLDDNVDVESDPGGQEYIGGHAPVPTTCVVRSEALPAVIPVSSEDLSLDDILGHAEDVIVYTATPEHGNPATFYVKLTKYTVDGEVFAHVDFRS